MKKLNKIGQTKKAYKECLVIIRKAKRGTFPVTKIGYCLCIKYIKLTYANSDNALLKTKQKSIKIFLSRLPILYFALIPKEPDLALLQFLVKSIPNVMNPIKCSNNIKYIRGGFEPCFKIRDIDPLTDAIEGKQSLKVIKVLASELKDKVQDQHYCDSILLLTIIRQDFAIFKFFAEKFFDNEDIFGKYDNLTYTAMENQNIPILKYLISKKKGQYKYEKSIYGSTPLHAILDICLSRKGSHNCMEVTKVILPKLENINHRNKFNETILDEVLQHWNAIPCLADIFKLIAPMLKNQSYENLLNIAVLGQDIETVKEFSKHLTNTNDVFSKYKHGSFKNPLHNAIRLGNIDIFKHLFQK